MLRLCLVMLLFFALPVLAAQKAKPDPVARLDTASKKLLKDMGANQTRQYAAIRESHGIIRAVEDVERNLEAAEDSCSRNHPEFAAAMQRRIGEWKSDIDPILSRARARKDAMIKLQDFAKPAEVKAYLKLLDAAVAYKNKGVKIVPITDKKQCRRLLGTLDDKQEDVKDLLIENLDLDKPLP